MPDDEDRQQQVEELGSDGDDGLGDFEIIDDTSPEQLAREGQPQSSSEDDAPAEVEETQEDGEAEQPESREPETDQPLDTADQPETPPEPEQPKQRAYSEQEVEQIRRETQAARDREVERYRQQVEQFNMDAAVEAQLQKLEQTWAPQLGEDEARRQVRDPRVRQELQNRYMRDRQLEQLQQRVATQEIEQGRTQLVQGMASWISNLKKEHGLTDTDVREMVEFIPDATFERADTYEQMGVRLARMAAQRGKLRKNQRVPAETQNTRLESGRPSANGRESDAQMIERLNMTRAEDWTDAEEHFMRTGKRLSRR